MAGRTGSADLPLHGGRVPPWMGQRMATLGAIVCQAIVHHYGRDEFLRRLSHPFWFQSFGAVMGMDWHSSGITTSVIGALKCGLAPLQDELGIHVCGGRGKHSRKTPDELTALGDRIGLDAPALTRASRLVAKVDSAAVQDGFDLYLHGFFVTDDGHWTVVQQGMNGDKRQARRYHWHSGTLTSFVEEPHSAIDGPAQGNIINLTDRRAGGSRSAQLDLLATLGPDRIVQEYAALSEAPILGIVSLVGMVIRNSVILIDQIDTEIASGQHPWNAVIAATQHRLRPILQDTKIAARIAELRAGLHKRHQVTVDRLVEEHAKLAFANMLDYVQIGGDGQPLLDFSKLTREQAAAICEITSETVLSASINAQAAAGEDLEGDSKRKVAVLKTKFKLHDKKGSLDSLGKHLGMFKADNEQAGKAAGEALGEAMNPRDLARAVLEILREAKMEKQACKD